MSAKDAAAPPQAAQQNKAPQQENNAAAQGVQPVQHLAGPGWVLDH